MVWPISSMFWVCRSVFRGDLLCTEVEDWDFGDGQGVVHRRRRGLFVDPAADPSIVRPSFDRSGGRDMTPFYRTSARHLCFEGVSCCARRCLDVFRGDFRCDHAVRALVFLCLAQSPYAFEAVSSSRSSTESVVLPVEWVHRTRTWCSTATGERVLAL